jgi:hypothetical protein
VERERRAAPRRRIEPGLSRRISGGPVRRRISFCECEQSGSGDGGARPDGRAVPFEWRTADAAVTVAAQRPVIRRRSQGSQRVLRSLPPPRHSARADGDRAQRRCESDLSANFFRVSPGSSRRASTRARRRRRWSFHTAISETALKSIWSQPSLSFYFALQHGASSAAAARRSAFTADEILIRGDRNKSFCPCICVVRGDASRRGAMP